MQLAITLVFLAALTGVGVAMLNSHRRNVAIRRVSASGGVGEEEVVLFVDPRSILVHHRWLAVLVTVGATLLLLLAFAFPLWLAVAFGFVAGSVAWIVEDFLYARRALRIEEQLADASDLIVSALRAGTSLVDAMTIASEECRKPLRPVIDELVRRLRLGDNPDSVFHDFAQRLPVETAQTLAFTLTVHWRVGGSLAPALATVGLNARHRIEFQRRVRSQATEGQASVIGILAITYLLTLLLWKAYPDRFEAFFTSELGIGITATAVFLQGIGLVWMSSLTRIKA